MSLAPEPSRQRWHTNALAALNARGFRLLYLLDAIAIYLTLWVVTLLQGELRTGFDPSGHLGRYLWTYAVVVVVQLAVFYFGGLYDRTARVLARPITARLVWSVWLASLLIGGVSLLLGDFPVPRSVLVINAVVGPFWLAANRQLVERLRRRREGPARAILVGAADTVALATDHLHRAGTDVQVVAVLDGIEHLEERVLAERVEVVLLLEGDFIEPLYHHGLDSLERVGVTILQLVRPHDSLLKLGDVGEIGGIPFVALSSHALTPSQVRLKRSMDLAVLLVTLPITVPVTLFTTLYVLALARTPLLFVQERVGRNGRGFAMVKFRSMTVDAEAGSGPVAATVGDPRIVRGLGWIRATRLDELPQLLNVLRGEMTVVGPRPVRPAELTAYERQFPGYHRRHQTPPGITGLAQVYGHYDTHIEHKLGHDLHYLANWSPLLDLQVMIRTAWVILTQRL